MATDTPQTFEEFAAQRADAGRPVAVLIDGDLDQNPPRGRSTAKRVAHILSDDPERIYYDDTDDDVDDPETLVLTLPVDYDSDDWKEMREATNLNRVRGQHIVCLVDGCPRALLDAADVSIRHSENGIEYIRRVKFSPTERGHYFVEMDGLTQAGEKP